MRCNSRCLTSNVEQSNSKKRKKHFNNTVLPCSYFFYGSFLGSQYHSNIFHISLFYFSRFFFLCVNAFTCVYLVSSTNLVFLLSFLWKCPLCSSSMGHNPWHQRSLKARKAEEHLNAQHIEPWSRRPHWVPSHVSQEQDIRPWSQQNFTAKHLKTIMPGLMVTHKQCLLFVFFHI